MKINVEIDLSPEEAKELFVPGEGQQEFMRKVYTETFKAVQESATQNFFQNFGFPTTGRKNND